MQSSGVPQPPQKAAYQTEGNAVTLNPTEERATHHHSYGNLVAERIPGSQSSSIQDAIPSSLGRGVHGVPAGEERFGQAQEEAGRHRELDGDQMRAPGEGRVADVVGRKPGATGLQPDLASDLDRKKLEQAEARHAVKEARQHGMTSNYGARGGSET